MDGILRGDLCPLLLAVTAGKHCLNLQAQQAFSTALTQRASQTGQTAASDQTTGHHWHTGQPDSRQDNLAAGQAANQAGRKAV